MRSMPGIIPNIVTYTTLIKGYSENDLITSAQSLLVDMLSGNMIPGMTQASPLPNTRTLNTFWRGCIRWGSVVSALTIFNLINKQTQLYDLNLFDETSYEYLITLLCQSFDFQTAINLTLQYLEIYSSIKTNVMNLYWIEEENDSNLEINLSDIPMDTPDNIQQLIKSATTRKMNIDSILNTASIFLNLSRTFILLNNYDIGQLLLTITENFIQETKSSSLRLAMEKRRKSEPSDSIAEQMSSSNKHHQNNTSHNSTSIILFLQHRSSELSRELTLLKSFLAQSNPKMKTVSSGSGTPASTTQLNIEDDEMTMSTENLENILNGYMKTLLFYNLRHVNEETKKNSSLDWKDQLQTGMLTQLNESFGLTNFASNFSSKNKVKYITRVMKAILNSIKVGAKASNSLSDPLTISTAYVTRSGFYVDFHSLYHQIHRQHSHQSLSQSMKRKDSSFSSQQQKKKTKLLKSPVISTADSDDVIDNQLQQLPELTPSSLDEIDVKMEICSGSGEWIIEQAMEYQRRLTKSNGNLLKPILWVALELRADRVYQALTHSILRKATNHVALFGGDASDILPDLIPNNSLTTIFINHPEPPERTSGGEDRSQGSHLLTGTLILFCPNDLLQYRKFLS